MTEKERAEKLSFIADMLGDWRPCQFGVLKDECADICKAEERGNEYCNSYDCWLKILQKLTRNS